jgi:hypothetical protein
MQRNLFMKLKIGNKFSYSTMLTRLLITKREMPFEMANLMMIINKFSYSTMLTRVLITKREMPFEMANLMMII